MDKLAKEIERMATDSPSSISTTKSYGKSWILTCSEILNIYGNIEDGDFEEKVDPKKLKVIQFARKFVVNENTLGKLNNCFLYNPDLSFGANFNGFGVFDDLQFLKQLPHLKNFGFYSPKQIDISPIKDFVQLKHLGLSGYNISLQPLEANSHLRSFGFGEKIKDTKTISSFFNLEDLRITSQKLKSVDFISPLKKLKRISFCFGGTTAFDFLNSSEGLEEVEIWRTRQLEIEHLKPINKIKNLRILKLRELPRITSLDWLENPSVQTLVLEDLKGLSTFDSLKYVPKLKELIIIGRVDYNQLLHIQELDNVESVQINERYLNEFSLSKNKFSKINSKYRL